MTNNRFTLWERISPLCKTRRSSGRSTRFSLSSLMPEVPNLGSLVLGILIGIFLTSLVVFAFSTSDITLKIPTGSTMETRNTTQPTNETVTANAEVSEQVINTQVVAVQEPRFDFYTELAQTNAPASEAKAQEVKEQTLVPKKAIPSQTATKAPTVVHKPNNLALKSKQKTINHYTVQAGTFRRAADADALKAKLALNGLRSRIESSKHSNGEVWSRVLLGPVQTEQNAKELQQALKTLNIESILVLEAAESQRG